jgi:hypothetical protein
MLRASNADREQVIAALERHTAAGRLTLDEYSDRVERTLQAATFADLAQVTADLPAELVQPGADPAADPMQSRSLLLAFALAALTVVILAILLSVAR